MKCIWKGTWREKTCRAPACPLHGRCSKCGMRAHRPDQFCNTITKNNDGPQSMKDMFRGI